MSLLMELERGRATNYKDAAPLALGRVDENLKP
jgi:hypothetical protein